MDIVCLDLEGVLVPEIWIAFAKESGIDELKKTTRDEPDYDKLMRWRIGVLKEHGLGLKQIQDVIAKIDPIPGAREFLDELRSLTQVIIVSDTFSQFAKPLMEKLGWPTIFCNSLEVAQDGEITGFKMRCEQSKLTTVKALQSIGFDTIASGDSYNDLGMIKAGMMTSLRSKIGALLVKPALKKTLKRFDATEYGGAPMIGLNGLVVKTHGNAKAKEVCNSILQCMTFKEQGINDKIKASIAAEQADEQ